MKGFGDNSWFAKIRDIMAKYDLGSALDVLNNPPSKVKWKGIVRKAVDKYWTEYIYLTFQIITPL